MESWAALMVITYDDDEGEIREGATPKSIGHIFPMEKIKEKPHTQRAQIGDPRGVFSPSFHHATEIAAANRTKKKKNQKEKTTQRPSLHTRSAGYILHLGRDGSANNQLD
ncbi:hypothetical protein DAPPUDRAFT_243799 [Daphnia pulex]|uniref:Uncharacterized protein n=1 Tax=Daphnia pulex TaxID=6669 RepID=E9GK57_DAPPU|nr:hypothetical protein DAPPUDRAFT_243799 [Daphnia pulex]|eukprot:EFX80302.1 hypothetical protein DAPPUDRAFT_243799 [Daphnia pulex]